MIRIPQRLYNFYFGLKGGARTSGKGPVFIIGTGRSGTHFLCSCLNEFDDLSDYFNGKESPYMFHEVSKLTVAQEDIPSYVIGYYKYMQRKVAPQILVDQTHPNIWNVERLISSFPAAKFIVTSRNVHSVVYSMKLHEGVSRWIREHAKYPKPNRFLGVTTENMHIYEDTLTDLQRAVFRWRAHEERADELVKKYPGFVIKVAYEDLYTDMKGEMRKLAEFLGVREPSTLRQFQGESLQKKNNFSDDEIQEIDNALRMYRASGI